MDKHFEKVFFSLLFAVGFAFGTVTTESILAGHELKHTQNVKCIGSQKIEGMKMKNGSDGVVYWMQRPNKEVFGMVFDNPAAMPQGVPLHDVVYSDVSSNGVLHFVKAQVQ